MSVLFQTWALVFQSNAELKEVGKMYQELKSKGIEFPDPDPDQATPVFIPSKVVHNVFVVFQFVLVDQFQLRIFAFFLGYLQLLLS